MNHEYAPKHVAESTSLASLVAIVFVAAILFLATPAGANEETSPDEERTPSPLTGMEAEFDASSNRLLVEIPEGCRLATYEGGEGFSLTIEDAEGKRTTLSGDGARVGISDGRLAIAATEDPGEKSEVVEAEGFVCLETPEEDEGRVLSQTTTASETDEEETTSSPESEESRTQNESSAGQQTEPLTGDATINRDENDDIESITITADCEDDEEATVEDGATVTIEEEGSGDPFEFTDGTGNVDITSDGSTITIAPTNADEDFVPGGNGDFEGDTATVEEQTDISCGAADDDAADTNTTEDAENSSCASGQSFSDVAAFSRSADASETMQTEEFTTTGDFFQIRFRATSTGTNADDTEFRATVLGGDNGAEGESFAANFSGGATSDSGTLTADLAAGTYRFRVVAENVQYDITVAECRAGSPTTSAPETSDPSRDVVTDTVPDKALANTGGPSLSVMAAGALFVVVGMSLAWLLARRGRGA